MANWTVSSTKTCNPAQWCFREPVQGCKWSDPQDIQEWFKKCRRACSRVVIQEVLGSGTKISSINLWKNILVEDLNRTQMSVGQVCDQMKTVFFTNSEVVILENTQINVKNNDVLSVVPRDECTDLYKFGSESTNMNCLPNSAMISTSITSGLLIQITSSSSPLVNQRQSLPNLSGIFCHAISPIRRMEAKIFDSHFKDIVLVVEFLRSELSSKMASSINGQNYFCTITDQYYHYRHVAGIVVKSKVAKLFESYKCLRQVQNYFPKIVDQ